MFDSESALVKSYTVFMAVIATAGIIDLIFDTFRFFNPYINLLHIIFEIGFIGFALVSGTFLWISYNKNYIKLAHSESRIQEITKERDLWRKKHDHAIKKIQSGIMEQFQKWKFSASESEVAIFLIRGYSHKQIAGMLEKSERTVRNQSLNIYKKSGMVGRSELTAFFLEDLFMIQED